MTIIVLIFLVLICSFCAVLKEGGSLKGKKPTTKKPTR